MINQSGVHSLHGRATSGGSNTVVKDVQKIRETVTAGLSDLLQGTFDSVDDSLFELANNARSNNEQNRYFEAMREVRIKRKGVEKRFQEGLYNLFERPPGPTAPATAPGNTHTSESLALVNNDTLEEQVAINAMVTKAKAHFQGTLLQLQARFSVLYKSAPGQPVNPLSPEHLCEVLVESIADLDIQIRERLIVLKQFDRYVIANLGMLLDEANRIMIQNGILTDFKYRARASSQVASRSTAGGTSQSPADIAATGDKEDSFNAIRQLLAGAGDHRLSAPPGAGAIHIVRDHELHALLAQLPMQPLAADLTRGQATVLDLRQIVAELLAEQPTSSGKASALAELDEDLINLVSMLFEFILDDYNLSPPIQVLISRLQIPILKVVIKDKTFFSKATHPARKLLNALARAGIGWSESGEKARDKLYERIHAIVMRILAEYQGEIALFETLNEEFDQFLARENRRATLVEQRTRESERGRIKSQKAQESVDQELSQKLHSNRLIPESIRNILQNGWSRVMFLAYLRDDNEHRWSQTVRVVDDLLWCLRPQPREDDRAQWVALVPALLKTLRAGLEEVSYNATRLDEMMADLKHELTEAFRRQALEEASEDSPPVLVDAVASEPPTAVERQQDIEDAAMAEHTQAIEDIGIGTWVEFALVNGSRFRCKLSAIIEEADSYVFVNRMGLKVVEKKCMDLAQDLRRGRLTLLEQGALIDRALDSVVGNLRQKAG